MMHVSAEPSRLPDGLRAMRHRNFRLMWFGQLTRGTSQWMQVTTIPLYVLSIGGTAVDISIAAALQYAPVLVLAPIGGVAADRVPRRRTLLWVQLALAADAAVLAVLTLVGTPDFAMIFALALAFGVANAVEMPFRQTYVAELLPPKDLLNGIALNQGAFQLTRVVAPAVAGILVQLAGVTVNFVVAAVASVTTFLLLWATRSEARTTGQFAVRAIGPQLREGLRHIRDEPTLRLAFVMVSGTAAFALSIQPILPIYATEVLGEDAGAYGVLLGAMGLGALAAAAPTALARRRDAMRRMVGGPAALGLIVLGLGLVAWYPVALVLMAVFGFFFVITVGSVNQITQATVRPELRGRVMGVSLGVQLGGVALGGLVAGFITEAWGASTVMIVSATLTGALAVLGAIWARRSSNRLEGAN